MEDAQIPRARTMLFDVGRVALPPLASVRDCVAADRGWNPITPPFSADIAGPINSLRCREACIESRLAVNGCVKSRLLAQKIELSCVGAARRQRISAAPTFLEQNIFSSPFEAGST